MRTCSDVCCGVGRNTTFLIRAGKVGIASTFAVGSYVVVVMVPVNYKRMLQGIWRNALFGFHDWVAIGIFHIDRVGQRYIQLTFGRLGQTPIAGYILSKIHSHCLTPMDSVEDSNMHMNVEVGRSIMRKPTQVLGEETKSTQGGCSIDRMAESITTGKETEANSKCVRLKREG